MHDLPAYLRRLELPPPSPDVEGLFALHQAHATHIPFENLDIQLGLGVSLELAALEDKLVGRRRGGYCFEQNNLFAAALAALGFPAPTAHHARVRMGRAGVGPRTHRVSTLELAGRRWLVDVGFGGDGLLLPVALEPGREQPQEAWCYRVEREGPLWVLWSRQPEGWIDLYAFSDEASFPVDDEVANHYTSTHPASRFVTTLTVQQVGRERRLVLRGRRHDEVRADGRRVRELASDDELHRVLRDDFGLEPPAGLRLPPG